MLGCVVLVREILAVWESVGCLLLPRGLGRSECLTYGVCNPPAVQFWDVINAVELGDQLCSEFLSCWFDFASVNTCVTSAHYG